MSGSQGSAASASSSSAQPPQPVQQLPEPDLELEGELIDADTANTEIPEPGDTQSRLQHALAALCLRHKPSETIELRMIRVFLDRVVPDAYRIQPKDTLLAMLMHKHFSIPVLTTREAVGKTSPSKHETSYGVQYRNLCIVGPDPKYNTDRTFAEESEERPKYVPKEPPYPLQTHCSRALQCQNTAAHPGQPRGWGTVFC